MNRKFTRLTAALALLVALAIPLGMWGQSTTATDVINNAATSSYLGNTGTSAWVNVFSITGSSGAAYSIRSMGTKDTNNALQWNANGYLYMTTSSEGNKLKSVTITTTANKNIGLYAQNTAYSAAPSGSALATIAATSSGATYTFTADYTYLALKGTTSSTSITNITIEWVSASGGSQTETYTVTYVPNGGTGEMTDPDSPYEENDPVTLLDNTFGAPEGKMWDSWLVKDASNNVLTVTDNQFTMPASNVTVTAQWKNDPSAPQYEWVLTNLADLTANDVFVIVGARSNSLYAMSNETSSNCPTAITGIEITGTKLTSTVSDNMKWNIVIVDNGYKFQPKGTNYYLAYSSSTTIHVGNYTSNNVFTYGEVSGNNYLQISSRYVCVATSDWRAYASQNVSSNATNTTFYKRQLVNTDPTINVEDLSIEIGYAAQTGVEIPYSISNPVDGTNLEAVSTDGWISNVTVGTNVVTFNASENTGTSDREGTITLTYGNYDTKVVTVTQGHYVAPAPEITAYPVELGYNATGGSISYNITNPVSGGELTAAVTAGNEGNWLTLGESLVTFSCTTNEGIAPRTATVTLTYTYGDNQTVSANAVVTQNPDPELGTLDHPYTVAQARLFIDGLGGQTSADGIHVNGIISQVDSYNSQYHSITYWISDDGTTTDQLQVYSGKGLNGADFNAVTDVEVSAEVVVKGKLKLYTSGNNSTYEFTQNSQLVVYNAPAVAVEAPVFSLAQGGYAMTQTVEITCETEGATIYYTTDGTVPTNASTAYPAAGIEVSQTTTIKTIAYVGEEYSTVAEAAYYILSTDNVYTVTEALAFNEYPVNNIFVSGIVSTAPTSLLDGGKLTYSISVDGEATDQLKVYKGSGLANTAFTAAEDIQVGDEVTIFGNVKIYNNETEFDNGNYLVTFNRPVAPVEPSITLSSYSISATAEETTAALDITYEYLTISSVSDFAIQYYDAEGEEIDEPDWISASVNEKELSKDDATYEVSYLIEANDGEARTTYFKVFADGGEDWVYSDLVTITQAAPVIDYATLPFAYGGNGQGELPNGLTVYGTGTYGSSPKIQFNNPDSQQVEDYVILHFNEAPGTLQFDIKGNGFSGGTFRVQTSVDGVTYTDKESYTEISSSIETKTISTLASEVRYIKWSYTKDQGNVAFGNINLSKSETHEEYDLTVSTLDEHITAIYVYDDPEGDALIDEGEAGTTSVLDGTVVYISIDAAEDYMLGTLTVVDADENDVEVNELEPNVYYSFTMPAKNVTISATAVEIPMAIYAYSINGTETAEQYAQVGSTITLVEGADLNPDFTFAGWTRNPNYVSQRLTSFDFPEEDAYVFYAVYAHTTGAAATRASMTIDKTTENFPTSYGQANTFTEYTLNGKKFQIQQVYYNSNSDTDCLQFRASGNNNGTGTIYNNESFGSISSIVLTYNSKDSDKNFTIKAGSQVNPTDGTEITPTINDVNNNEYTFDLSGDNYSYFVLTNGLKAGYLDNIIINYNDGPSGPTTAYYTRVFLDETLTGNYTIAGPSIIPAGKYLDTDGKELNSTDADNFLIEEGGQLRHTGLGGVQVTMQKSITGYSNYEGTAANGGCWNLIAIPLRGSMTSLLTPTHFGLITDELGSEATPETSTYDLYKFSSDGGGIGGDGKEWRNYRQPQVQNGFYIEPNMGYLYANRDNKAFSFQGAVDYRNGDVSVSDGFDWMLYGNPFPCDAYIILESGEASFYRMNDAGDDFIAVQGAIKPLEGVFVLNSGDFKFSRTAPVTTPGVNVNVNSGSQVIDRAIVSFGHGNMLPKRMLNENNTKLYIPQGTQDYAVVNAQSQGEMPVNFKANKNGNYTISVNAENTEMTYLHLIDNMTGADVDLLATPSYTFEASTTDYASRFRLVFNANDENGASTGSATFAYYNGSEWVISNMGEATLQVVDVMGRVLSTETIHGNATMSTNNLGAGVYVMRLINGENVMTQKIVVR